MSEFIVTNTSKQRWILVSVAFAVFMPNLGINIVNISLPVISKHFSVSIGMVSRVVLVYFLVLSSSLLGFGKLGDTITAVRVRWLYDRSSLKNL